MSKEEGDGRGAYEPPDFGRALTPVPPRFLGPMLGPTHTHRFSDLPTSLRMDVRTSCYALIRTKLRTEPVDAHVGQKCVRGKNAYGYNDKVDYKMADELLDWY